MSLEGDEKMLLERRSFNLNIECEYKYSSEPGKRSIFTQKEQYGYKCRQQIKLFGYKITQFRRSFLLQMATVMN